MFKFQKLVESGTFHLRNEEVQARMRDPAFRKICERMWKMEGLFAEAKQNHGLSRACYRGRSKVQIQAYLSAIVQNLKRLVAALWCWLITRSQRHPKRHLPNHLSCQKADVLNRPDPFPGIGERLALRIVFLACWPASPHYRRVPQPIRAEPCLGRTKPERTVLPGRAPTSRGRRRQSAGVFANDAAPGILVWG